MSDNEIKTTEGAAKAPAERKEYRLKKPIIQGGTEKKEGDKIALTKAQAERFFASGHI